MNKVVPFLFHMFSYGPMSKTQVLKTSWNQNLDFSIVYLVYQNVVLNMGSKLPNAKKSTLRYCWLNIVASFLFQVFYYGPMAKTQVLKLPENQIWTVLVHLMYKNVIFNVDLESSKEKKSILRNHWLNKVVSFLFQVFCHGPMGKTQVLKTSRNPNLDFL